MMKKIVCIVYVVLIIVMAAATIVGNSRGQDYASEHVYGAWWFTALWAVGVAAGIAYFLQRRVRRLSVVVLHLSFVVILVGAAITHFTAAEGSLHLRQGQAVSSYQDEDGVTQALPFTIRLDHFGVSYHAGQAAVMDYQSAVTVKREGREETYTISMNHIYNRYGTRLYQSSFDEDMQGSVLAVSSDPWGIPVTYCGYGLLFISLLWMLIDRRGTFRTLLRSQVVRGAMLLLPLMAMTLPTEAQSVLPRPTADRFARTFIVYNGRICPMETFAIDFTKKLYGRTSYNGFTATQVLTGFMFWPEEWMQQPVVKVKGGQLREQMGMERYVAPAAFFDQNGYRLGQFLADASQKNDAFSKQVLDMDDKLMLVMQVAEGSPLKMFPFTTGHGVVEWFTPTDSLPAQMPKAQQQYVHSILLMAKQLAREGKTDMENELFDKLLKYQHRFGGASVPSKQRVRAEHIYNEVPFATILFIVNLTLGFLSIFFITRRHQHTFFSLAMALSFVALTIALALRWIISGTIPIGNGYETMLFMAWLIMLVALLSSSRLHIMTTFGLLMSGFMLLVSHIGEMDPAITPRMPVLNSPLLSIHVSIIMMAYALLSLTFIASLAWLIVDFLGKHYHLNIPSLGGACEVQSFGGACEGLSKIFLYPAMTCLGLGIFIGAIWANVSWGNYWSWDPKETWALITFMVYAVALHGQSLPAMRRPRVYHIYMLLAFLSLLVTYFGVNYFMSGMHSYA